LLNGIVIGFNNLFGNFSSYCPVIRDNKLKPSAVMGI
jgi:hypothetical protein